MGNTCVGTGCCNPKSNGSNARKPLDKPFTDPSPVYQTEHPGYHLSLAKMDSAPSSSVVGIQTGNGSGSGAHGHLNSSGLGVHHHLIANSEASLLRISCHHHHNGDRRSFVPRIPPLGRSGSNSEKYGSESKMNTFFDKYRDCDEAILVPGTEALLNDLELRPDEFCVLIFAWKCNAEQMCRFTRAEFLQGCRALKADNIKSVQQRLPEAAAEALARSDLFKDLYRYTFRFGLASTSCATSSELRCLPIDMAMSLWQLVFSPREPAILPNWLKFLQSHSDTVRGISKDTWNMLLNFSETVGNDLSVYDEDEAWPSLFDDFVEHENDKANQNYQNQEYKENNKSDTEETNEQTGFIMQQ